MEKDKNPMKHELGLKLQRLVEVFLVSMKLGLTSFGGPIAHLGYFHDEYIRRRKWMDERSYADLVALCQLLPGPASSQVGMGIGLIRAGLLGGITAWIGFTLPSVLVLILFAFFMQGYDIGDAGWIHGLKLVAVAIVAQAILSMGQKLTPDRSRATLAIIAMTITLLWPTAWSQVLIILVAGLIGMLFYRKSELPSGTSLTIPIRRRTAIICLTVFVGLLVILPILRPTINGTGLSLFDSFYRSGSLVFGGGHVVLPMLEREVVPTGWVTKADFLAGYGAAQAVPGPLFTFASYLGAMTSGVEGALIATVAIFLPAFLLIVGTLPFWSSIWRSPKLQGAFIGINASVVGILLAALYNPLWISAILTPVDFAFTSILFLMLVFWKLPPWSVVMTGAIGGTVISLLLM